MIIMYWMMRDGFCRFFMFSDQNPGVPAQAIALGFGLVLASSFDIP